MDVIKSGLTFKQAKGMADLAIRDVKNGIVTAGYALRAIRNERLWKEHGYASFDTFMEICYQKDKSWASNCIRVYEQFGELAGPEQMPRLKERYQEYTAGGLIEMLSMPEELRDQVTAGMPVREMRELKREAKKVAASQLEKEAEKEAEEAKEEQIDGQMEIYDFPEYMPELWAASVQQKEPDASNAQQEKKTEPDEREEEDGWIARETGGSDVIHVTELADGTDEWDGLDEEPAAEGQPERRWPKTCITGWSKYGNCVCCGKEGVQCCASCQESCNVRCGWIPEPAEGQEGRQIEVPETNTLSESLPEESDLEEEKGESDEEEEREASEGEQEDQKAAQGKISAEKLLEKYEKDLTAMREAFRDMPKEQWPLTVEKTQILAEALRLLVEQERQQKEPEPLKEQPELPRMKNNDQRKEWLRNYQSWGLWYEDEHIGARYYKYDFDNGARLIAEEYPAAGKRDFTAYYLHLVGGPEPPKHPSYGCPRWSRHERYSKYPDSETELIEFLKAAQR